MSQCDTPSTPSVRLTSLSNCAGCAAKLSPAQLAGILSPISEIFKNEEYPDLLTGLNPPDDAAVWKLDEKRALVMTTDFFPPVVDDPYDYGAIAAANSISDIYAMGGKPFLALNVAAIPPQLDPAISAEIFRGGADIAKEAGVVIAGGHTIQDKEPKYGLAVVGIVHPERIITKGGAKPGDKLVLTKPLGFGVTTTALKQGVAATEDVEEVVSWMTHLNNIAADMAEEFELKCGTDVTGFSLLGHGSEIARSSAAGLRLVFEQIPFVRGARKYAEMKTFPGGMDNNRNHFGVNVHFSDKINETSRMLLFDPQTSGGLLLAVPARRMRSFFEEAQSSGQPVWEIGEVVEGSGIQVV
jgi:selenide,water dikinase